MVYLRAGIVADMPALWALRTRCVRETCRTHYPPEVIAPWAASPAPVQFGPLIEAGGCVVAEDADGNLLGYGVIDLHANEVDALFVDPDRPGQGIGAQVLASLEGLADPGRPVVLSASLNAVPFYQRMGFVADGAALYPHPSGIALESMRMHKAARREGAVGAADKR